MSKLCHTSDIKYTILIVEKEEMSYAIEMVVNYLEDENEIDMDDPDVVAAAANGIYGFINTGKFWHPITDLDPDSHWTVPILKEYHNDHMIILKGSPNEVSNTVTDITGEDNPYLLSYDIWKTDAGIVAIIT